MAVQVTLTFNSYDEAIVALGKLVEAATGSPGRKSAAVTDAGKAAEQAANPTSTPAASVPSPTTRARKPRSDAGQPRGSYKARNEQSATEGATADPAGASAPGEPQAPSRAPETAAPQAPSAVRQESPAITPVERDPAVAAAPTEKDAQAALEKLFNEKAKAGGNGAAIQAAKDLLARYGVQKVRDLPADRRVEFIKECAAGGAV